MHSPPLKYNKIENRRMSTMSNEDTTPKSEEPETPAERKF